VRKRKADVVAVSLDQTAERNIIVTIARNYSTEQNNEQADKLKASLLRIFWTRPLYQIRGGLGTNKLWNGMGERKV
jgi:hypothetical protein